MDFAGRMYNFGCRANEKRWQLCLEKNGGAETKRVFTVRTSQTHKRVAITKLHTAAADSAAYKYCCCWLARAIGAVVKLEKEQPQGGRVWVGNFSIMFMAFENTTRSVEAKSRKADRHDNVVIARGDSYLLLPIQTSSLVKTYTTREFVFKLNATEQSFFFFILHKLNQWRFYLFIIKYRPVEPFIQL